MSRPFSIADILGGAPCSDKSGAVDIECQGAPPDGDKSDTDSELSEGSGDESNPAGTPVDPTALGAFQWDARMAPIPGLSGFPGSSSGQQSLAELQMLLGFGGN